VRLCLSIVDPLPAPPLHPLPASRIPSSQRPPRPTGRCGSQGRRMRGRYRLIGPESSIGDFRIAGDVMQTLGCRILRRAAKDGLRPPLADGFVMQPTWRTDGTGFPGCVGQSGASRWGFSLVRGGVQIAGSVFQALFFCLGGIGVRQRSRSLAVVLSCSSISRLP